MDGAGIVLCSLQINKKDSIVELPCLEDDVKLETVVVQNMRWLAIFHQ